MNYEEAKKLHECGRDVYRAHIDGEVWSAGRMVDVGETIGYYATEEEALKACASRELFDFDKIHMITSVELCDDGEFDC